MLFVLCAAVAFCSAKCIRAGAALDGAVTVRLDALIYSAQNYNAPL